MQVVDVAVRVEQVLVFVVPLDLDSLKSFPSQVFRVVHVDEVFLLSIWLVLQRDQLTLVQVLQINLVWIQFTISALPLFVDERLRLGLRRILLQVI